MMIAQRLNNYTLKSELTDLQINQYESDIISKAK